MGEDVETVGQVDNTEQSSEQATPLLRSGVSAAEAGRKSGQARRARRKQAQPTTYATVEQAMEAKARQGDAAASREWRALRADAAAARADNIEGVANLEDMSEHELARLRARLLLMAQRLEGWAGRRVMAGQGVALAREQGELPAAVQADPAPPRDGSIGAREVSGEPRTERHTDAPLLAADLEPSAEQPAPVPPPRTMGGRGDISALAEEEPDIFSE